MTHFVLKMVSFNANIKGERAQAGDGQEDLTLPGLFSMEESTLLFYSGILIS